MGQFGVVKHRFMDQRKSDQILVEVNYWLLVASTTICPLSIVVNAPRTDALVVQGRSAADSSWTVGLGFWINLFSVPLVVTEFSLCAVAVQDGPDGRARWRFGEKAN